MSSLAGVNDRPKLTKFVAPSLLEDIFIPNCDSRFLEDIDRKKGSSSFEALVKADNLQAEIDCIEYEVDQLKTKVRNLQRGVVAYARAANDYMDRLEGGE